MPRLDKPGKPAQAKKLTALVYNELRTNMGKRDNRAKGRKFNKAEINAVFGANKTKLNRRVIADRLMKSTRTRGMNYSLIMVVPESLQIDAVDGSGDYVIGNDIVYTTAQLNAVWPATIVPGTHPVASKKLAHAVITITSDDPLGMVNDLIILYALPWVVMGVQPFIETLVDDGAGNMISLVQKNMDLAILSYINDRYTYDVNGNQTGTQTKALNWLHQYAGQGSWL